MCHAVICHHNHLHINIVIIINNSNNYANNYENYAKDKIINEGNRKRNQKHIIISIQEQLFNSNK